MSERAGYRLRMRRRLRSLPPVRATSVLSQVLRHPSNRGNRAEALVRSLRWQVLSRVSTRPRDVQMHGGLILRAHPRSNSASNVIYFTPYFDPVEMHFLRRYLSPGDCFVDCGANIGTYSLLAASVVGKTGHVVAFEPVDLATRLRENVELNGLQDIIDVRQVAVGERRAVGLITSARDVSNSLVLSEWASLATEQVEVVPVTPDDLPALPTLVKLDVEGYEMAALNGMVSLLRGPRPPCILVELTPHLLRRAGTSADEVAKFLLAFDYLLYVTTARHDGFVPADIAEVESRQANYLAVPRQHLPHVEVILSSSTPETPRWRTRMHRVSR